MARRAPKLKRGSRPEGIHKGAFRGEGQDMPARRVRALPHRRHVEQMNKTHRPWPALLTALLFLPFLAAAPAAAGACPRTYDSGAATGDVYLWVGGNTYKRYEADSVTWVDGCGGKGCDDRVAGVYRTSDDAAYYFSLEEYRLEDYDDCFVHCLFDRPDGGREERYISGSSDKVTPHGADGVDFSCGSFFFGDAQLENLVIRIARVGLA